MYTKSVAQQIDVLCSALGIKQADIARAMNISPQSLNQRIKRGTLTPAELKAIAELFSCQYETAFVLPDGQRIAY